MKLKKANAVLGLLSAPLLLMHIGYTVYSFLTMYYNPALKKATAIPFAITVVLHAVCGMLSVFLMGDGTRLGLYPKQNRKTVVQRVTAAFIFPLLILHLRAFDVLRTCAGKGLWGPFGLVILLQVIFYAVVLAHTAVSLTRGCVTLGWLSSREKQTRIERVILVVFAAVFVVAAFAVVRGMIAMIPMFVSQGGAS